MNCHIAANPALSRRQMDRLSAFAEAHCDKATERQQFSAGSERHGIAIERITPAALVEDHFVEDEYERARR